MSEYWLLITVGGVVVLGLVIAIAMRGNRKHNSPAEIARTERATHDLEEEIDRDDKD